MSVKIEILDYKYGSGDNMTDVNQASSGLSSGWTAASSTNAAWDGSGSGVTFLANISSQSLVIGRTYNLSFKIYNYSGTGDMGFSTSSGVPYAARFAGNTSGVQYFTFVATGTSFPDLYGRDTNTGNISSISITDASVIDWDNSVVGELDVTDHSDFPLAMTFQISDIKDLTSTSGDYSKTFKIPATKNNNKLLKNPYIPNIDTEVNINENKKCRILVNNLFSIVGLIKITGVSGYGETPSHYDCVFFGNNLSWADDLSNKYMNELDWGVNGQDLEYNKTSIMATWQDEDCDSSTSPIVYPITSYGDYNPDGEPKTIQLLDTAYEDSPYNQNLGKDGYYGFNESSTSYGTPLPSSDWRPAVFVKDTLEKIFSEVGYSINSTFMETDMFKKLVWLLPNFKYNNAEEQYDEYSVESNFTNGVSMSATVYSGGVASTVTEDGVLESYYGGYVTYNDGDANYIGNPTAQGSEGTKLIPLDATRLNVTLDEGSYVDTTNDYITIGEFGYYDIKLNGLEARLANARKGGSDVKHIHVIKVCVNLDVQTVGHSSWVTLDRCEDEQTPLNSAGNADVNANSSQFSSYQNLSSINSVGTWLNKGDKIRLTTGFKITSITGSSSYAQNFMVTTFTRSASSSNLDITLNSEAVDYGQTYDLKDVINKDYKSLDFIKGIAHAFNLKMTTDEVTRVVNIEPFNSFYKDYAEAIDWTYKLDRSKQIDDKWIKSDLKRDIVFKYKSDSKDKKVEVRGETYWDGIKDEYPYQETLPKTFEKGESKYENPFFAGTYNAKDQDTTGGQIDTAYSSCLWEGTPSPNDSYRPDKGYEFLPRLLYWNKYSPASGSGTKIAEVQTWSSVTNFITADASANPTYHLSTIYPQATSINRDDSSSPILSYGNVNVRDYDDTTGIYTSYAAGKGLFATYYKNMFEMLKTKPRLRTVYVDLKVVDIINLDFTKLIYIDGVYWRINKVVDYQPNKNQSTKVELIEWLTLGAFAATAPSFGGNNNTGGLNGNDTPEDDNDNWGL